jgi:pilus assembly protein Flp/PilA
MFVRIVNHRPDRLDSERKRNALKRRHFSRDHDPMPNDALAGGAKLSRLVLRLVPRLPRIRDEVASNFRKKESPMFMRFLRDERGATAVEYGLITALISLAMIASLNALGIGLSNTFSTVSTQLADMK